MTHSLDPYGAPEAVKQYLDERNIRPGDRVYIRTLRPLTDPVLATEYDSHRALGRSHGQAIEKIATEFNRSVKTICPRLRRLRPTLSEAGQ